MYSNCIVELLVMKIENYEAKSLVRQGGVSIFSWAETYLNPYQGCYHDCVYCDGTLIDEDLDFCEWCGHSFIIEIITKK